MGSLLNGRVEVSSSLKGSCYLYGIVGFVLFLSLKALLDQHGLDHWISQQEGRGEKGAKPQPLFASVSGLETCYLLGYAQGLGFTWEV